MKFKLWSLILGLLFVTACSSESVEVTRIVENEVEVTRIIEVTRQVEKEIEVTRVVEITREVEVPLEVTREVEVTRIVEVEVEVSAIPTETPTPLPTNTPLPPSSSQDDSSSQPTEGTNTEETSIEETLLDTMIQVRTNMQNFGGMIDSALRSGVISCQEVVNTYDNVVLAPSFDVTNASPTVQNAHATYRAAIDIFGNGSRDMAENCRSAITDNSGTSIGYQQWALARQEVNSAIDTIHPAIQNLGGE